MAGVPEDRVGRRVEHPVEGQRQLDRSEVRAEVAGVVGHRGDDEVADLAGEFVELRVGEVAADRRDHEHAPGTCGRDAISAGTSVPRAGAYRSSHARQQPVRPDRQGRSRDRGQQRHRARDGRGPREPWRRHRHLGDQPRQERCRRRSARPVRRGGAVDRVRRQRRGRGRGGDGRHRDRTRSHRCRVRQRRREQPIDELRRHDGRRLAARDGGQPRRRVLHRPRGGAAHGRPPRGWRRGRRIDRVHHVGIGLLRPAVGAELRRLEGRCERDDEGDRGAARPSRHPVRTPCCRDGSRPR